MPAARPTPQPAVRLAPLLLAVAVVACAAPPRREALDAAARVELEAEVRATLTTLADDLTTHGPRAWARHALPGEAFAMASDGRLLFPDGDALRRFVDDFAASVSDMQLTWREQHVDVLSPELAWVGAGYDESITTTDGEVAAFGGYCSALLQRVDGVWKVRHLHWSSPPAEGGD